MNRIIRRFVIFGLLTVPMIPVGHAMPVLAALGWAGIEATVETLLEETLHVYFNPQATQKDLQALQQQVSRV